MNRYPVGKDTSSISLLEIKKDMEILDSTVGRTLKTEGVVQSLIDFSNPEQLDRVARWMCLRLMENDAYVASDRKLTYIGLHKDSVLWLPVDPQLPDYQKLKELRDFIWSGLIPDQTA